MKRRLITVCIFLMSIQAYAQQSSNFEEVFEEAKNSDTPIVTSVVTGTGNGSNTTVQNCEDNTQKTMPLFFLNKLIRPKDKNVELGPPTGRPLSIGGDDLTYVANCQDMLELEIVHPDEHDADDYLVRFNFKKNDDICSDGKCKYKVIGADDAEFTPDFGGFMQCMEHAGVIEIDKDQTDYAKNKIVIKKYKKENEAKREFNFVRELRDLAGNIHYSSIGPMSQGKAVHKKIRTNPQTCEYVEEMVDGGFRVMSSSEVESHENYLEFAKLCKNGDYKKLLDNSTKLKEFKDKIEYIVKQGVIKDFKALSKKIKKAKEHDDITEDDEELIKLMKSQVIDPIISDINMYGILYEDEDDKEKKKKYKKKLTELKKELKKYTSSPYFTEKLRKKLIKIGHIDATKPVFLALKAQEIYKRVGNTRKGLTASKAKEAMSKVREAYDELEKKLKKTEERKNCENQDELKEYTIKVSLYTKALQTIDTRTQKNINDAIEQMQKKCFVYYRNQRRCVKQYTDGINSCKKRRLKAKELLRKRLAEAKKELAEIKKYAKACEEVEVDDEDLDEDSIADILDPDYLDVDVVDNDVDLNNGQGYTWTNQSNGNYSNQNYNGNTGWNANAGMNTGWNTNTGFNTGWNGNAGYNNGWNGGNTGWLNNGSGNIPWRMGAANNGINFNTGANFGYFGNSQPPFATPGINGNANFGSANYSLGSGGPNRFNFNYGMFQ